MLTMKNVLYKFQLLLLLLLLLFIIIIGNIVCQHTRKINFIDSNRCSRYANTVTAKYKYMDRWQGFASKAQNSKITSINQTSTCTVYITKSSVLRMIFLAPVISEIYRKEPWYNETLALCHIKVPLKLEITIANFLTVPLHKYIYILTNRRLDLKFYYYLVWTSQFVSSTHQIKLLNANLNCYTDLKYCMRLFEIW